MKEYLIISETLREAVYCYNYMLRLVGDKATYVNKPARIIHIDGYMLRFINEETYWRFGCRGNRAKVTSCEYILRQLDRYRILKGETQ